VTVGDDPVAMKSITVALPDDAAERLLELAGRERRTPRDQAAVVLIAALRRFPANTQRPTLRKPVIR
jgi:hypothetical protein